MCLPKGAHPAGVHERSTPITPPLHLTQSRQFVLNPQHSLKAASGEESRQGKTIKPTPSHGNADVSPEPSLRLWPSLSTRLVGPNRGRSNNRRQATDAAPRWLGSNTTRGGNTCPTSSRSFLLAAVLSLHRRLVFRLCNLFLGRRFRGLRRLFLGRGGIFRRSNLQRRREGGRGCTQDDVRISRRLYRPCIPNHAGTEPYADFSPGQAAFRKDGIIQ